MRREPRTVLGFDYGLRHIGVAVGQTVTGTATPVGSIDHRGSRPDWDAIARLVTAWGPDALVVGDPLNMDGTEQPITRAARRFARQLQGRFHLPVHSADERLSTREAHARLGPRRRRLGDDHPVAAQVVLETWLSEHRAPATIGQPARYSDGETEMAVDRARDDGPAEETIP